MLISEVISPDVQVFQTFANQTKTQYGLHSFDIWADKNGDVKLNSLVVPAKDRRTGLGTATMLALCRFADTYGRRIVLSPASREDKLGTTSTKRLVSFYKRFGFVQNKGRKKDFRLSDGMYREARSITQ